LAAKRVSEQPLVPPSDSGCRSDIPDSRASVQAVDVHRLDSKGIAADADHCVGRDLNRVEVVRYVDGSDLEALRREDEPTATSARTRLRVAPRAEALQVWPLQIAAA
jgi:hypothetical protein